MVLAEMPLPILANNSAKNVLYLAIVLPWFTYHVGKTNSRSIFDHP